MTPAPGMSPPDARPLDAGPVHGHPLAGRTVAGRELLALAAVLVLAALLRLPGLDERGRWDADQGHDMLVLSALVTHGEIPLLGPPTSIGTFHHGALYYYLLAPSAFLSGADPIAVTGEIALVGIAAVAATWWLARLVGGQLAGIAAALLAAVSPAGIDESTFIWNPNLIPLVAAVAFGAAIRAWQTRRARWWLLAAAGAMATSQLHVLGIVVVPPLALAWAADVRRRARSEADPARPLLLVGLASLLIIAAGYVPLVVHELGHDFSETRAILDYVAGGGRSSDVGALARLVMVGLRSVTWPLTGLITDRPALSVLAAVIAVALGAVAVTAGRGAGRGFAAWLAGTLGWSVAALAVFAPSLAVVTPGLPNDHYHAFLDPLVLALCGVGLARLVDAGRARLPDTALGPGTDAGRARLPDAARAPGTGPRRPPLTVPAVVSGAGFVALVAMAVVAWPPAVAEDGGWRLVDQAAARVISTVSRAAGEAGGSGPTSTMLVGIPPFKSADALRFPLERRGLGPIVVPSGSAATGASATATAGAAAIAGSVAAAGTMVVIVCDPLFDEVVGAPCGGPAEDAWRAANEPAMAPVDRFDAGPRRVISIFQVP